MPVSTVLLLASIGVLSLFCQWLAWHVRMPAILFLLAGGIASGPVLGYLNPEDVFGDLLFPMVSLAVAIILFEGSLTLRRIRPADGNHHGFVDGQHEAGAGRQYSGVQGIPKRTADFRAVYHSGGAH